MFPRGTERMAMRQSVLNGLKIKCHIIRLILDKFLLVTISDITLTFPFQACRWSTPRDCKQKGNYPMKHGGLEEGNNDGGPMLVKCPDNE